MLGNAARFMKLTIVISAIGGSRTRAVSDQAEIAALFGKTNTRELQQFIAFSLLAVRGLVGIIL